MSLFEHTTYSRMQGLGTCCTCKRELTTGEMYYQVIWPGLQKGNTVYCEACPPAGAEGAKRRWINRNARARKRP